MVNTTTHRDEEEALKAIRDDLFNFTEKANTKLFRNYKLDQMELVKDCIWLESFSIFIYSFIGFVK